VSYLRERGREREGEREREREREREGGERKRETIERQKYKKYSNQDREKIVTCANRGEDWVVYATTLGIKYKTGFHWVRSGREVMLKKGGIKPKALVEDEINTIVEWIEDDCGLTLKQVKEKVLANFRKNVSASTIGNYLKGSLFTMNQVH
jgi:transposase